MCGADAYCHPVDSYISIKTLKRFPRSICVDCRGLRYSTKLAFEFFNTISAGLPPSLRLHGRGTFISASKSPNHPAVFIQMALHSSHLMTCGRISYLIQPPVPVRPKTLEVHGIAQADSSECLHSRTYLFLKQVLDTGTMARGKQPGWVLRLRVRLRLEAVFLCGY